MQKVKKEVEKPAGTCSVTGRTLAEGEEFFTALFEEGDSFRRVDYSTEAWSGPPEGAFCFFRTQVPRKEQKSKRLLVDDEMLVNFFERLEGERQPIRMQFRFVLAMILMRKRLLKYVDSSTSDGKELWRLKRPKEEKVHEVLNPRLTDEEIEAVSRELTAILSGDVQQLVQELEERAGTDSGSAQDEPSEGEGADPDRNDQD